MTGLSSSSLSSKKIVVAGFSEACTRASNTTLSSLAVSTSNNNSKSNSSNNNNSILLTPNNKKNSNTHHGRNNNSKTVTTYIILVGLAILTIIYCKYDEWKNNNNNKTQSSLKIDEQLYNHKITIHDDGTKSSTPLKIVSSSSTKTQSTTSGGSHRAGPLLSKQDYDHVPSSKILSSRIGTTNTNDTIINVDTDTKQSTATKFRHERAIPRSPNVHQQHIHKFTNRIQSKINITLPIEKTSTSCLVTNQTCQIQFRNNKTSFCYFIPYGANFGDELGPAVAKQLLLGYFGRQCQFDTISIINLRTDRPKRRGRTCFYTLGSILHMVQPGDSIWGTGANPYWLYPSKDKRKLSPRITVYSTRGPQTWNIFRQYQPSSTIVPTTNKNFVHGDPGFLTPLLYPEYQRTVPATDLKNRFCIVPHYHDIDTVRTIFPNDTTITITSPKNSWEYVIRRLASRCDYIASSSLHGLIIADALQIPSQWVQFPNSTTEITEGWFKYIDYYESVNRFDQKPVRSFHQIKNISAYLTPLSDAQYRTYVTTMIQSFPYHLLESKCV